MPETGSEFRLYLLLSGHAEFSELGGVSRKFDLSLLPLSNDTNISTLIAGKCFASSAPQCRGQHQIWYGWSPENQNALHRVEEAYMAIIHTITGQRMVVDSGSSSDDAKALPYGPDMIRLPPGVGTSTAFACDPRNITSQQLPIPSVTLLHVELAW